MDGEIVEFNPTEHNTWVLKLAGCTLTPSFQTGEMYLMFVGNSGIDIRAVAFPATSLPLIIERLQELKDELDRM